MTGFRRYEEVAVGDRFPAEPLDFDVTPATVRAFLDATGDRNPHYGTALGDAVPSMIAAVYLIDLLRARLSPPGGIHAKQAIRFHRALRVGERVALQARVVETYIRKDRPYVVSDFEARDDEGALVSSGCITSIWGQDA